MLAEVEDVAADVAVGVVAAAAADDASSPRAAAVADALCYRQPAASPFYFRG